MTRPRPIEPAAEMPMVHGPAIGMETGLLPWLAAREKERAVLQVPVVVNGKGWRPNEARLATPLPATQPIEVHLDDSALGVALVDRMKIGSLPADGARAAWLEGTWNSTTRPPTLRVTRWVRPIVDAELASPLFARLVVAADADRTVLEALDRLGEEVPPAVKQKASEDLVAGGTRAIPWLIASLGDGRTFAIRDVANRTNLPVTESPEPVLATRTVGTHCEDLLYRIVTPPSRSAVDHRGKVISTQQLSIRDWNAFWLERRSLSLAAIHAELTPLVDAYWAQHGTTQRVD